MFYLRKKFEFQAAHRLMHHEGSCRDLHGHSYRMELILQAQSLQPSGPCKNMLVDFADIKKTVKPLIEKHLDHKFLNDTLATDSPTAEFIAEWIYKQLKPKLPQLHEVHLWETETCGVAYREESPSQEKSC